MNAPDALASPAARPTDAAATPPEPGLAGPFDAVEQVHAPTTLADALRLLAEAPDATLLAGGTDLMPQGLAGRVRPTSTLINLRRLDALRGVHRDGDALVVGALTTLTDVLHDPLLGECATLLVDAARHFASDQIRNAATLGGNVCNASPAGDTLPPLLALDAEVELARLGDDGAAIATRRLPVAEFWHGPGRTARAPGELLTALLVPCHRGPRRDRFHKAGTRAGLDISTISIALAARLGAGGVLRDVRLALGAVAPTPVRARHAEALLEGNLLTPVLAEQAALCASEEATPIDDVRASAWYRRELVRNMTKRMLDDVSQA